MKAILAVLGLVMMSTVYAQQVGPTLGELERRERLENAMRALGEFDAATTKLVAVRDMACKKAIGSERFCACLSEKLPIAWTFDNYVAITTKSKDENQYATLPKDYKAAYDAVGPIRDKCVAIFVQPTLQPRR